ncbi:MAG: sialidase family protein [Bdellovibrionales bacterium]
MRILIPVLLAIALVFFQNCTEVGRAPQLGIQEPQESAEPVLVMSRPGVHLAFPQIVAGPNGELMAFVNVGSNHYGSCNDTQVELLTSLDGGVTWSAPKSTLKESAASVTLTSVVSDGSKLVASIERKQFSSNCDRTSASTKSYEIVESSDAGLTWTARSPLRSHAFGTPIKNDLGQWLFSSYWGGEYTALGLKSAAGNLINASGLINDHTGNVTRPFPFESGAAPYAFSEANYIAMGGGRIYGVARAIKDFYTTKPRDYYLFESLSVDGGVTWSEPLYVRRGGPAELILLRDGSVIRCFTYRKVYHLFGGEKPLILDDTEPLQSGGIYCQVSQDQAQSWSMAKLVAANNSHWDMGYVEGIEHPSVDGRIILLHYDNDGLGDSLASVTDSDSVGERTYRIWRIGITKAELLRP